MLCYYFHVTGRGSVAQVPTLCLLGGTAGREQTEGGRRNKHTPICGGNGSLGDFIVESGASGVRALNP